MLEEIGRAFQHFAVVDFRTYSGMWTYEETFPALRAQGRIPNRHPVGNTSFLIFSCGRRINAVYRKGAYRQFVAFTTNDLRKNVLHKIRCISGGDTLHL